MTQARAPKGAGVPASPRMLEFAEATGPGPDGRTATTDRKIIAAVLALLVREGPARVSIESVAAESGVAKTSIYRRYANTEAMVEDALERVSDSLAPPPLDLPADGEWTQEQWTRALDTALRVLIQDLGTGTAVTLLSEPASETARILRQHLVRPRLQQMRQLLQMQVDAGRISSRTDLDVVVEFVLGSAYVHLARHGELAGDWADRVRNTLISSFGPPETPEALETQETPETSAGPGA